MANPQLNSSQLEQANKEINRIRKDIDRLAKNDPDLIFAFRRKIQRTLMHDERGKPVERRKLKDTMWKKQRGLCAICKEELPEKYTELDRYVAKKGYVEGNVRLVHRECHIKSQSEKGYK